MGFVHALISRLIYTSAVNILQYKSYLMLDLKYNQHVIRVCIHLSTITFLVYEHLRKPIIPKFIFSKLCYKVRRQINP